MNYSSKHNLKCMDCGRYYPAGTLKKKMFGCDKDGCYGAMIVVKNKVDGMHKKGISNIRNFLHRHGVIKLYGRTDKEWNEAMKNASNGI